MNKSTLVVDRRRRGSAPVAMLSLGRCSQMVQHTLSAFEQGDETHKNVGDLVPPANDLTSPRFE